MTTRRSTRPSDSRVPTWWLVFRKELTELWIGGRALNLLILFSVLLGITTFLLATNSELSLIPPKEMVFLTLQASISFGIFIGMIIGADSISGERERKTLESYLLTPTSPRQIITGKFLAAISPWPAAFLISLPALVVVSQGEEVLGQALVLGAIVGTLLALAFAGFGVLTSFWSNSIKNSMFVCLAVWLLLFLPTQLPGEAQKGSVGDLVQAINPMEASNEFLEKVLVNNRTVAEKATFLRSPVLAPIVILFLLFLMANRLSLEPSVARRFRSRWALVGTALGLVGLLLFVSVPAALGQDSASSKTGKRPLTITIDTKYSEAKTGDELDFTTSLENAGKTRSAPMILALNIINLDSEGDVVDPEDWSPERTQYVKALSPGRSVDHDWTIDAILKGDYLVYVVGIPQPGGPTTTAEPITSPGIHLTVHPFTRLNPKGVLPVAIFVPIGLTVSILAAIRLRLRRLAERVLEE